MGPGRQHNSAKYNRFGAVVGVLQRPPAAVVVPSLADQAACAAQDKGIADYSEPLLGQIVAAYRLLCRGRHVPSPSVDVSAALLSAKLRVELDAKLAAELMEGRQTPRRQKQLTERDFVMLHVFPHANQSESLDQTLVQRLHDCVPKSKWPGHVVAAARASNGLNRFILDQLCDEASATVGGKVAALSTTLAECDIYSSDGTLTEMPMRCKCEREVLAASGLLQASQRRITVVLPCGLALSAELQPDNWETVRVMMTGLSPEIKLADASLIVADLLKGTNAAFTLTAPCSQPSDEESKRQDGLTRLGIRLVTPPTVSASRGTEAVRRSKRDLLLQVRRDAVHLLPPARAVLVVRPATAAQPATTEEMVYVKFEVSAQDGQTDARKCYSCGRDGHIAATCTAMRGGQVADYVVYASPPAPSSRPPNRAAVHNKQTPSSEVTQAQTQQAPPPALDADGFSTDRRQLNRQPPRNNPQTSVTASTVAPAVSTVSAAVSAGLPTVQPTAAATAVVSEQRDTAALQQAVADEPIDAEVLALSEREEMPNRMEQLLQARHEVLALCLTEHDIVAAEHAEQFSELLTAHTSGLTDLTEAHERAKHTLAKLRATPLLPPPSGKTKAKKSGNKLHEQQCEAARKHNTQLQTSITTAQCIEARLDALIQPYQAFAKRLQQHSDPQMQSGKDLLNIPQKPTADMCESPLSPVIQMPPDSQDARATQPQSVADAAQAVAVDIAKTSVAVLPQPERAVSDLHAASTVDHDAVTATTAAATVGAREATSTSRLECELPPSQPNTAAIALEQHRTELLSRNMTAFDIAEQQGVQAEQARVLAVQNTVAQPNVDTERQGNSHMGESDTEHSSGHHSDRDSQDSGPSEGSESECSDAPTTPTASKRTNRTINQNGPTLSQQIEAVPVTRQLRPRRARDGSSAKRDATRAAASTHTPSN